EYDVETGTIANPTPFLAPDAAPGQPDGVAVDEDGCLWMARFGGGCVLRLSPEGRIIGRIDLPTTNVTSCAFGGVDLKTLFITTATALLSDAERAAQPMAGALFAVRPGVGGVPEARMAV
ncbi:MAG: SMP-30/gluconolactonase/LRE family protein, partial [Alphaproteobacteria bacterium]|nr:SMP-30/gluconolactonase/LRE family protein [Alphaproteobacteria bacterium]